MDSRRVTYKPAGPTVRETIFWINPKSCGFSILWVEPNLDPTPGPVLSGKTPMPPVHLLSASCPGCPAPGRALHNWTPGCLQVYHTPLPSARSTVPPPGLCPVCPPCLECTPSSPPPLRMPSSRQLSSGTTPSPLPPAPGDLLTSCVFTYTDMCNGVS
ncbi:pectinesterase inhibitor 10-like [Vombatus ursinus]|uniref:pectinesterase inhibitor 10-like n=1 Tax=Vombatus ursinus TaxID=29139 RepID=UPI000FFDBA9C|nr:pectinesterase inhibitor 10-like [Vombatus ursinus]